MGYVYSWPNRFLEGRAGQHSDFFREIQVPPPAIRRAELIGQLATSLGVPEDAQKAFICDVEDLLAEIRRTTKQRPHWKKRIGSVLMMNPVEFIETYYADEIEAGTFNLSVVRREDKPLYDAYYNWRRKNPQSLVVGPLLTKAKWRIRREEERK